MDSLTLVTQRTGIQAVKKGKKCAESKLVKQGGVITHYDISGEFVLSDVRTLDD